jgi:hypothetical protein
VKALDRIKTIGHFDFELLLERSDLGCSFKNCWSWEMISFTHGRLRELLKLDRKIV